MVLLILSGEVSVSPYIIPYINILNAKEIDYKIIAWRPRDNTGLYSNPTGTIEYSVKKRSNSKINKIINYLGYRRFVLKQIKRYNPEKIVFLTTPSVFLIPKYVIKKYQGKFIFDFRDATYEYMNFYRKKVRYIAKQSYFTSISSRGFEKIFDGISKTVLCHNVYDYQTIKYEQKTEKNTTLTILYFGIVRDLSGILGLFDNDSRFQLIIYGKMDEQTEQKFNSYLESNKISNIHFKGSYTKGQLKEIIKQADAILYYYKKTYNFNLALGNRFYDCLKYYKPMIVNPYIFCGDLVVKNNVGIGFDKNNLELSQNNVYKYITELNTISLKKQCEYLLQKVEKENIFWIEKITSFLTDDR